ncbi:hypothetical protein L7F22_007515 [Adiantum nelumboides]|nr:hypothetical protein [Adiantum nelumboides]
MSEKVEIFVQAADSHLQKSLVQLLEDPAEELGLTNDWDAIPAAINLLVKRQKRIDKSIVVDSHEDFEENGIVEKIVEKPKASSSPMLEGKEKSKATQSSTLDDSTMDDLIKAEAGKVTSFTLRQAGDSIRETTGWTDPVDSHLVYAYIAKAQANEAFVEDKRKREDEAPETSKRQTRANTRSDGERMQKLTPIPEVQMEDASKNKKQSKERILNSKVEMTLGDILGIAKRKFHEEIIDIIKRKRHVPVEQETNPTNSQNILHEELEDLEEPRARMENDVLLETKHAHFHENEESDEVPRSHFLRSHWARATTETVVKIGEFEEPNLALVDHGLEINLMSKTLYQKEKWPIDLIMGGEYALLTHNQPYIIALRMETKVLDDGSAYARVRSKDGAQKVYVAAFSALDCVKLQRGPSEHPSASRMIMRLAIELVGKPYDLSTAFNANRITKRLADGYSEGPCCVFSALNYVKSQHGTSKHPSANRLVMRLALKFADKSYNLSASFNGSRITKRLADGCSEGSRCIFSVLNCVKLQREPSEHPSASRITIRVAIELASKPYDLSALSNASRLIIRLADECSKSLHFGF